jgi:tetratricopeptide (TPR) repeat protein
MRTKNTIILVLVGCVVLGLLLFLNNIYIKIRFLELRNYFKQIDKNEISIDHINLVSRYIINKKVYRRQISEEKADAVKFNIQSLLSSRAETQSQSILKNRVFAIPVLYLVNINRFLLNKPFIKEIGDKDEKNFCLDLAYYYERNNMFRKALENYDRVLLKISSDSYLVPGVMLHTGFCLALLGKYELAKEKYTAIIQKYSGENITITASILLRYLDFFQSEKQKVQNVKEDSISKSIKLLRLFSFDKALKILEKMEPASSKWEKSKIKYFKGECYNGLGKPEKAIRVYLEIIAGDPNSKYGKFSNRRIFEIGQRTGNREVKKLARSLNIYYNDEIIKNYNERKSLFPDQQRLKIPLSDIKFDRSLLKRKNFIHKKAKKTSQKGKIVEVATTDGNVFKGTLVSSTKKDISIVTFFGEVKVNRKKIKRLEVIE